MGIIGLFVGLFGVFVGVVWYYMGLFLYKSGGKYEKMGIFCGFLVVFCVGVGGVLESLEGGGGCKGVYFVGLWNYLYKFFELERIK